MYIKKEKGITLIALVITIIILLILAGIVIASLSGENGILTRASEAKEKTTQEGEKEQIKLAYNAAKADKLVNGDNTLVASDLQKELDKQNAGASATDKVKKIEVTFSKSGNRYLIDSDGTIEERKLSEEEAKWEKILKEANENPDKYKHPEQESSKAIAIGTDGNAINMDLWYYEVSPNGGYNLAHGVNYGSDQGYGLAYKGTDFDNIVMPQYIKGENDEEFLPVDNLTATFYGCNSLVVAPKIPSSVTDMDTTFFGCTNLTTVPKIPNSVTNMNNTFHGCTGLTTAPEIPSSVTDMSNTFAECIGLTTAPVIPNSVTDMSSTFYGCTGLITAPEIPSSVTCMYDTFFGCTGLTTAPVIPNSVTNMTGTFYGCTSLTIAPEIPNSVTTMNSTFEGCIALTTAPKISNSVINMDGTFSGCTGLTTAPEIPSSVTNMDGTFIGCIALTTAPEIPNSVTYMGDTFSGCTSLTGIVKIKSSNVRGASDIFKDIQNSLTVQVPRGSDTYLAIDLSVHGQNNITIEQVL